jgi:hypothetical protein
MISGHEISIALVSSGFGAGIGTLGAAYIQARANKGETRARAADLVTGASDRMLVRFEMQNGKMRAAIITATNDLDVVLDEMNEHPLWQKKMRKISRILRASLT